MPEITDATLAEIEARVQGRRAYEQHRTPLGSSGSLYDLDEIDRLIAALRASCEREKELGGLLRRYHERVTADDDVLAGTIASRSYLNDAMSKLPHPTIGDEVSAALGEEAPHV